MNVLTKYEVSFTASAIKTENICYNLVKNCFSAILLILIATIHVYHVLFYTRASEQEYYY